ncbi:MAG: hypothetical protein GY757_19020 [bacterium]|nr:hypothetical protein [bacterium]
MNIETIMNNVERYGKARTDYCEKVSKLADKIIGILDEPTRLGGGFEVATRRSNAGSSLQLLNDDGCSLGDASPGGGSTYLHGDFNCPLTYADYEMCEEFIEHIKSEFGDQTEWLDELEKKSSDL